MQQLHKSSNKPTKATLVGIIGVAAVLVMLAGLNLTASSSVQASGGGGGGSTTPVASPNADSVKISKAYTNAGGELLIKAASSNPAAHLFAYRSDGSLIGEVQNGGGSKYGGTVMPYQSTPVLSVTVTSSLSGSQTVPTTPFQI